MNNLQLRLEHAKFFVCPEAFLFDSVQHFLREHEEKELKKIVIEYDRIFKTVLIRVVTLDSDSVIFSSEGIFDTCKLKRKELKKFTDALSMIFFVTAKNRWQKKIITAEVYKK